MDSYEYLKLNLLFFSSYSKQMLLTAKTKHEETWYASRIKFVASFLKEVDAHESQFRANDFGPLETSSKHDQENMERLDKQIRDNPDLKRRLGIK